MFLGNIIILLPLMIGYCIYVQRQLILWLINKFLIWISYFIPFLMGINLTFLDNFHSNAFVIFFYSLVTNVVILLCNIITLFFLECTIPWRNHQNKINLIVPSVNILDILKPCSILILGFLFGLTGFSFLQFAKEISKYALFFLLFLIGIQLRNNEVKMKKIILSKHGMIVAMIVVTSSLLGGVINAFILNLPFKITLSMASGFGWYSLSSILLTESFGPVIGGAAFFNDLGRELIAIMLIPSIINRSRSIALGICGATSMDVALPTLQRLGGLDIVPSAIIHGFILSVLVPILMGFFSIKF